MKKLLVLGLLGLFGRAHADLVDKVNPYIDKYGAKAGDALEKKINKVADDKLIKPMQKFNEDLKQQANQQKKLLKENAQNAAERAALALWAKIKGWFSRK